MKIKFFCSVIILLGAVLFAQPLTVIKGSSYILPIGKTLFADVDKNFSLESENPQVASVCGRLVYANAEGEAKVFIKKNGEVAGHINVTIGLSEGVKSCYTAPNNVYAGNEITITAVTDRSVENVRFVLNENGTRKEIPTKIKNEDGNNFMYASTFVVNNFGKHRFYAEFLRNGDWNRAFSSEGFILVNGKNENDITEKRVSDRGINYIASKEGFHAGLAEDRLVGNTYDIGYGNTIRRGSVFYNNVTQKEAMANLTNLINNGIYAKSVNDFILKNKIKCSQNQFDALVSFTYNLGPGWLSNSSLRNVFLKGNDKNLNCVGRVNSNNGLNLREEASCSGKRLLAMRYGEEVEIDGEERYNGNWLKVKTGSGTVGYCCSDFLDVTKFSVDEKDLAGISKEQIVAEMLQYHHAGGKCVPGLLYRRIEELQMFLYNDYSMDGASNKYGFEYPKCILPIIRG